jgi:hypothetical protein
MSRLYKDHVLALCMLLAALACVSCGSEQLAGGGIGGTGITSGTVNGFGSIFVNGVEFDTAGASRRIDDVLSVASGTDDAAVLGLGMVVTVTGKVNADGVTGTATAVNYDEVVEGPISADPAEDLDGVTKTFEVLDITIVADRNSTVFVDTDYASLAMDQVVEVSGYFDASGRLIATRIDGQGVLGAGTVVELHGTVSGFDGVDSFMLGNIAVVFNGTTVFEDLPGSVVNGQIVEVAGLLVTPVSISAQRIELEEDNLSYSGEISLEGIVSAFAGLNSFLVSGQPVDASSAVYNPASLAATLGDNQRIEVMGEIAGGVLVAKEVEQRGGDIKIAGRVTGKDVGAGIVDIEVVSGQPSIPVSTDAKSQLEDELSGLKPFTLSDLVIGDEVIIEGYQGNAGNISVAQLKRKILEKYLLQGTVDAASGNALAGSVTILGVAMQTDSSTVFEDANDQPFPAGGDDFYSQVSAGDLVEVEDQVPVDGIADEVEFAD